MRKWMRERMKRRKKPSENLSESTGKIGQAIDPMKPAPLMPSYDSRATASTEPAEAPPEPRPNPPRQRNNPPRQRNNPPPRNPGRPREESARHETAHTTDAELEDSGAAEQEDSAASATSQSLGLDAAAPSREPRGVVVLTIGLPGSGKTTWYKRRGVIPLSSDTLRQLLFDNETEQRYQGLVFSTLRSLLRARLIAKRPMNYVDATNLSPHERRQWIKMARGFGYEVHAVFFDVPLELCLERNRKRNRQVSEDVMQQMATRLKPPSFKEGFSKIVVVRVKKGETEPQS